MPVGIGLGRPAVTFTKFGMEFLTDDAELRRIITRCKTDMGFFAHRFFPGIYRDPDTNKPVKKLRDQQIEGWKFLQDHTIPKLALERWRGGAKSSDITVLFCHAQYFRWAPYGVYASHSLDLATEQTEDIKSEIVGNERLLDVFGSLKAQPFKGKRYGFGKDAYFLSDPITGAPIGLIRAKSSLTSNRGLNVTLNGVKFRINLGVWDDVEDEDHADDPKYCERIAKKFYAGFLRAVSHQRPCTYGEYKHRWKPTGDPNWKPPWRIIVADTPKSEYCLIDGIEGQPDWKFLRQPYAEYRTDEGDIVDGPDEGGKLYSLVEDISDAQVRLDEETERKANRYHMFSMEMLLKVVPPGQRLWKKSEFVHYNEWTEKLSARRHLFKCITWDPSRTDGVESSAAGFLVWAFDPLTSMVYFRDEVMEIMGSAEQTATLFRLAQKWDTWCFAIEEIGLHDWAQQNVYNAANAYRRYPEYIWLNQGTMTRGSEMGEDREAIKRARLQLARPLYDPKPGFPKGNVVHNITMKDGFVERGLVKAPRAKGYWDILDPVGYTNVVMNIKNLHIFHRPETQTTEQKLSEFEAFRARMARDLRMGRDQIA